MMALDRIDGRGLPDDLDLPNGERMRRAMRRQVSIGLGVSIGAGLLWFYLPSPLLIVGLALTPIVTTLVIKQPYILCLAFIALSFFRLHEAFPQLYELHLPLTLAIACVVVLGTQLAAGRIKPYWSRELTYFSLFFLHVTISVMFATNRANSLAYWIDTYSKIAIMVPAIAWLARSPRELALAGKVLVAAGVAVSLVAIHNTGDPANLVEGTRVTIGRDMGSLLGDPNDLSLVLLFPISFAVAYVLSPGMSWTNRLFGLVSAILILVAILDTKSRGGLLGAAAVFAVFALRTIKSRILTIGIGGLGAMALFALAGIAARQSGGTGEGGIDESAAGRLYAWQAAFRMARDHPLFGVGIDNFPGNFFFYTSNWEGFAKAVHSTWFGVLAETGFVGLALFVVLVVATVRRSFGSLRALDRMRNAGVRMNLEAYAIAQAVLAGLASFIVSGSFLTQGFTWPIYILLALALSVSHFAASMAAGGTGDGAEPASPETGR
ncbi:MAG TPA: O-antigen ligase family protein [Aliidongia sp.]|nr:O-antigen ligase family protein [Aliidongia sp.]